MARQPFPSMALALAANGAEGETLNEICETAEIYDISKFNDVSKNIIEKYNNAKAFDLKVANSIWINKDKSSKNFSENYKNKVADFYRKGTIGQKNLKKAFISYFHSLLWHGFCK